MWACQPVFSQTWSPGFPRPVGLNLLLSSYRFNQPVSEVTRATLPMLLVLLIGVLLITYFPPLTTFLPGLFK